MTKPLKTAVRPVTVYRNEGNPLDPDDSRATMVKPGEMIDIREMEPLTLYDRRCYNLLVANAWDEIEEDKETTSSLKRCCAGHTKATNASGTWYTG